MGFSIKILNLPKKKAWRLLFFISAASLGLLLFFISLYHFREICLQPLLKKAIASTLESQLGLKATVRDIRGNYLSNLEIGDLEIKDEKPDSPLASASFQALRLEFSPLALAHGVQSFLETLTLAVRGGRMEFHKEKDCSLEFEGLNLSPAPHEGIGTETAIYHLAVDLTRFTHPALGTREGSLSADIAYTVKSLKIDAVKIGAFPFLEKVAVNIEDLSSLATTFQCSILGGQVELEGKLLGSLLQARIKSPGLNPAELIPLLPANTLPAMEGSITTNASLEMDTANPESLKGDLSLQWQDLKMGDLDLGKARLEAMAEKGALRIRGFDGQLGGSIISASDLSFPLKAIREADGRSLLAQASGRISLKSEDLPSLFSLANIKLPPVNTPVPPHLLTLEGELKQGKFIVKNGKLQTKSGSIEAKDVDIILPVEGQSPWLTPVHASLKADFPDLSQPAVLLGFPSLNGSMRGSVVIDGVLESPHGLLDMEARKFSINGHPLGDLDVLAKADSQTITVESLKIQQGKDRISGHGAYGIKERLFTGAELDFSIEDIAYYSKEFSKINFPYLSKSTFFSALPSGGSLRGGLAINGALESPSGALKIEARNFSINGRPLGDIHIRAKADSQVATVESLEIQRGKDRISGHGSYRIKERQLTGAELNISIQEMATYLKDFWPEKHLPRGSIHATATATGPLTEPKAAIDMVIKNGEAGGVGFSRLDLKATNVGREFKISEARAETSHGTVLLAGTIARSPSNESFDFSLDALNFSGPGIAIALQDPARAVYDSGGSLSIKNFVIGGKPGTFSAQGILSRDGESDMAITAKDLSGKGWFGPLTGQDRLSFNGASLLFHVGGNFSSPRISLAGTVPEVTGKDLPVVFSGKFDASYENRKILIREFDWSAGEGQRMSAHGSIPFNPFAKESLPPGELSVDASFDAPHLEAWALLFPPEFAVTGNAKGELQLSGTWESPTGGLRLKASELDIQGGTALYPPGPFQLDCELAIKDRRVIFNNFLIESANLFFLASGYWAVDLAHEKISVEENFWQRGDVEFNGKLRIPDISWAANRWQDLREVAGELDADISIKGSVQKPTMNATLNLQNGKIQAVKELTPIRALSVHAKADTEKIQIETMTGELGSAPFQVSGALFFDPKVEPRLDFHLKGENLLLFRDDGVKLRADADIGLKGQFHAMELAGAIYITEGRFTKDFDFLDLLRQSKRPKDKPGSNLFSLRDPPFKGMVFNVRVSSRNPFILKNNLTNASLRPELFLKGTGEVPVLVGEVYVDPSYIKLPSGRLAVESGVIRFMEAAPGMPRINLPAQTYISGYDISMLMEGLWNEPHVTLSSIPILPAEDLLLMVLTGKPPKGNTGSGRFSGAELNIAVYFGKGLLSQLFGAKLTESAESTIDRFELDIGRGATQGGQETLEAQYRLAEGVIFEGDTLYIAGERDAYDDFNAGLKIIFRFR